MTDNDTEEFLRMFGKAMGAYAKPLPEAGIIAAWIEMLKPYPLRVIGMAFAGYCSENGEFPPLPAGISKRCQLLDGRPGVEEAWALALSSRDEADTVVWTKECAEAFAACQTVLLLGDEIGARMVFKEAYNRLVGSARLFGRPVVWQASLGWDISRRTVALKNAVTAGLLPAPSVAALLPPPKVSRDQIDDNARAQLDKIKKLLADMAEEHATKINLHEQREREILAARKKELNEQAGNI